MTRDDRLARVESSQLIQTVLLVYIATQFGSAWSTGDVVFTLIAGVVVIVGAWLAWKILCGARRVVTTYGWPSVMVAVVMLAAIIEVWNGGGR